MSIFTPIAKLRYCCYCIPLKIGCIIIALIVVAYFGASLASFFSTKDEDSLYDLSVADILALVIMAAQFLLFVSAILFLIGVCFDAEWTVTLFLWALVLNIVISFCCFIAMLIASAVDTGIEEFPLLNLIPGLGFILWIYFIVVVASYEEEME